MVKLWFFIVYYIRLCSLVCWHYIALFDTRLRDWMRYDVSYCDKLFYTQNINIDKMVYWLQTLQLIQCWHINIWDDTLMLVAWVTILLFCSIGAMLGQKDVLVTGVNAWGVISALDSGLSVKCTKLNKIK